MNGDLLPQKIFRRMPPPARDGGWGKGVLAYADDGIATVSAPAGDADRIRQMIARRERSPSASGRLPQPETDERERFITARIYYKEVSAIFCRSAGSRQVENAMIMRDFAGEPVGMGHR